MKARNLLLVLAAAVLFVAGCGSEPKTPEEVAEAVLMAQLEGDEDVVFFKAEMPDGTINESVKCRLRRRPAPEGKVPEWAAVY